MSESPLTIHNASVECAKAVLRLKEYPDRFSGRGIVICGGGLHYFTNAWVCINMLRENGCKLPIQLWYKGTAEYDVRMRIALSPLSVVLVNACRVRGKKGRQFLGGWQLKPFAILHCQFQEVLYIDADNVPLVDPSYLFETPEYHDTGAIFWPDFGHFRKDDPIWAICGLSFRDEPEFESGQIVVDKKKCWKELQLALWFNEHSNFFYKYILGDKDTFHLAFMKLGTRYSMPPTPVKALQFTMCQHDFSGRRIFQHRNMDKWLFDGGNKTIFGFDSEERCRDYIQRLRHLWNQYDSSGMLLRLGIETENVKVIKHHFTNNLFLYNRVGYDMREMAFSSRGNIDVGSAEMERRWHIGEKANKLYLTIFSSDGVTCTLKQHSDLIWRGRWRKFERMQVELAFQKDVTEGNVKLTQLPRIEPTTKSNRIVFRAPLNAYTGYGLHSCEICSFFIRRNIDLSLRATSLNETFAPLPLEIRKRISAREISAEWELLLHPPGCEPLPDRKTVYFTMWESTRLPPEFARNLNRAECIVVPSAWNASCFVASGVDRPIRVVPLGIKTDVFRYREMSLDGPCVFGTAGRLESGGVRKGLNDVISLFQKAFPKQKDVELHVKAFPDCAITKMDDPRIRIVQEFYGPDKLADWFSGLTCFVSASKGEGWGLMQHQALAVGRPLISVLFGGVGEFFTEDMGYLVDYTLVPGVDIYKDCGLWAEPNLEHAIGLMRNVYLDRTEARLKGLFASTRVNKYSWEASNKALLNVLLDVGMLTL